ncbi:MAG: RdgB/HAM1 family non-canonical purine NTP pyrophosphatase [Treponema sp.]|nr:RdgB/HAM1 family non-canonical purine NTP pyrophosphatase [Treponema sp.]
MKIWFATNNAHKKRELEAILGIQICIPSEENIPFNPEETGTTFCENALIKARELKNLIGGKNDFVIADDSGLCVDALNGRPGVLSARYGDTEGKKLTSAQKNLLLLDELGDSQKRSARFSCAMVLLVTNNRFTVVQEIIEGEIVKSREMMRGEGGFGYDPIFYLPSYGRTFAELSEDEKNGISHRGKAGKIISGILTAKYAEL